MIFYSVVNKRTTKRSSAPVLKEQRSRVPQKTILLGAFIVVVPALLFLWLWSRGTVSTSSENHQSSVGVKMSGEALARVYCQTCHLFVEPALLDQRTWKEHVLPDMKARLGLDPESIEEHPEADLLKATGAFASRPLLSIEEWNLIESYYLSNAPALQPTGRLEKIEVGLPGFDLEIPPEPRGEPTTTLTFIDERRGEVLVGDATALRVFDSSNRLRQTILMDKMPVAVRSVDSGIYVTSIGSFIPSEKADGSLSFFSRNGDSYGSPKVILSNLQRPTMTSFGDLNGDGLEDLVVPMFGHLAGRLSWFENLGDDNYKEHVLKKRPGSIQTALKDMNGDGFLDIVVLTAAETEAMEIFYNNGKGGFAPEIIYRKHPAFAHTHFELADLDGDGKEDLIISNGATGEWFTSTLKAFHGLRIFRNHGGGKFEEAFFFRMNGAYQFTVGDFDQDGDLDIAAVSFYPDYRHASAESFVYLQNQGNLTFQAFTFPEVLTGRWITVHAGDLDGDGDLDLVLGSKFNGPSSVPKVLFNNWVEEGPSYIILRNRLR